MMNPLVRRTTTIRKKNHSSYTEGKFIYENGSNPSNQSLTFNFLLSNRQFDRDTPHHLKNKRVQQGLLTDKAANLIISNALKQQEMNLKSVENIIPEDAEKDEHAVESGK